MANYKIIGTADPKELFGSDDNVFLVLKTMNIVKETFNKLGAEITPPMVWNKTDNAMSKTFLLALTSRVATELKDNKEWKPTTEFKDNMRRLLKTYVDREVKDGKM